MPNVTPLPTARETEPRPLLRHDLVISARTDSSVPYHMIEDPANSKFYRVGRPEYTFLSLLDGRTTPTDAARVVAQRFPDSQFSADDAAQLCHWLVQCDLVHTTAAASGTGRRAGWHRLNLITVQLPLLHPDRWFDKVAPYTSWMFGRYAACVWAVVVACALYRIHADWGRFAVSAHGIFAPGNWIWLTACWLGLKIVHEMSHGVVCKMHGGSVREAGVLLIVLFPAAYVDVTSCWRFPSRWQRIHTAAAGMYAEFFVAALAAIVWAGVPAGPLSNLCFRVVMMASITTVLFNANPLMRFDGYYLLSDLLGIPNLYARGQQRIGLWLRRYLLGVEVPVEGHSGCQSRAVAVYGVLSLGWRVLVCVGLAISASALFAGAGIAIAATGVATWLCGPSVRLVKYLIRGTPTEKPNLVRLAWAGSLAAACVAMPLFGLPWIGARTAPAVVEHEPLTFVRAASSGFVRELRVRNGQHVQPGDVVAVLDNPQLEMELADLELALKQLELKQRALANRHQTAQWQAHQEHRLALEQRQAEKRAQVAGLTVRAPIEGAVIGRNLSSLAGSYVDEGATILALADEQHKELKISVSQEDMDPFTASLGRCVRVRLPGLASIRGTLAELNPRAGIDPPHPALCAVQGGPLAVRTRSHQDGAGQPQYELFAPRFTGTVRLAAGQGGAVRAGQRGIVALTDYRECVAGYFYRTAVDWVRNRITRATTRQG